MAKFLSRTIYPRVSRERPRKASPAAKITNAVSSSHSGAKTEARYFSYGEDDVVVIIEAEPATAVALSMAVNQSGAARLATTPLLTSAEMDAARSQVPQFRAPGAR